MKIMKNGDKHKNIVGMSVLVVLSVAGIYLYTRKNANKIFSKGVEQ